MSDPDLDPDLSERHDSACLSTDGTGLCDCAQVDGLRDTAWYRRAIRDERSARRSDMTRALAIVRELLACLPRCDAPKCHAPATHSETYILRGDDAPDDACDKHVRILFDPRSSYPTHFIARRATDLLRDHKR